MYNLSNTKETLSKGERTRQGILAATLSVIAQQGLRAVTHRAVAASAGVQLSLTTYYFRDINDLILQAFIYFCDNTREDYEAFWNEIFSEVEAHTPAQLRTSAVRKELCNKLSRKASDYIELQIKEKQEGLAVEQCLFSERRLNHELSVLSEQHRHYLLAPLIRFCRFFNHADPEIDAELLLDSLTRIEYQAQTGGRREQQHRAALIKRQLGWAMGIKQA